MKFGFDFSSLRQGVASLGGQVRDLRARIERMKRERDDLIAAPAAKSDLKAAALQHLKAQESAYARVVAAQFATFIRRPERLNDPAMVAKQLGLLGATEKPGVAVAGPQSMDVVLAGLFGPMVCQAYLAAIDALDYEEGPTNAARAVRIAELDGEIQGLQGQLDELTATARGAGIVIEA
jgi:uncharacterized protein (UPF0335 family)